MSDTSDKSSNESLKEKISELNVNVPTYPYKSSSEYAAAVNQWLWQCYNLQCMALTLPYFLSQAACRNQQPSGDSTTDFNRNFPNTFFPNQNLFSSQPRRPNTSLQAQNATPAAQAQGTEYLIPSLWKRFAAEVIDFFILLIFKVVITYVAVDFFDLINLEKLDFDLIKKERIDYYKAMEFTSEIVALELVHRVIVFLFEAVCLSGGMYGFGGATPGKSFMNLKVVLCHSVEVVNEGVVRVQPATDIGIGWSLLRAFIKNFSLAFVFPVGFTMFLFQHNRTAYDIICNSIVVEEMPERLPRN